MDSLSIAFLAFAFIAGIIFRGELDMLNRKKRRRRTVREIERQAITQPVEEDA